MATSLLQVRVEDSLKEESAKIFEDLGIDISTAVRMFLKRAVKVKGIPFNMTLQETPYLAEEGYQAMLRLQEASEKNGTSKMTLDDVNREIKATRRKRRGSDA
ncbi:MAG: type II toxin-antitoxin system RelB/DinJ family antitoxin [Lachnospiraceae bacterium]|nr:type II toxin-antitoxin system RelB/DinJ family antitoxin [Lachnospiraceae bacterium]